MSAPTYKSITFFLKVTDTGGNEYRYDVHPSYDGVTSKYEQESDERYFNASCSNKFYFTGDEFNLILSQGMRAKFTLYVEKHGETVMAGTFRLSDCEVDVNRRTITVEVRIDENTAINDNKDTEYNLVKLTPEMRSISYDIRPCLQIYVDGSNSMDMFVGKSHESKEVTSCINVPNYCFGVAIFINMKCNQSYEGTVIGEFKRYFNKISLNTTYEVVNLNGYKIKFEVTNRKSSSDEDYTLRVNFKLLKYNSSTSQWVLMNMTSGESFLVPELADEIMLTRAGGFSWTFNSNSFIVFFRLLSAKSTLSNYEPFSVSNDDTLFHSTMYGGRILLETGDIDIQSYINVTQSNATSSEPTEYGLIEGTELYYDKPAGLSSPIPVYKEAWADGNSFWIDDDFMNNISQVVSKYSVSRNIGDFYRLGSVIKKLLGKIDESIIFEEDDVHSSFLFSANNPITGDAQSQIYITQKSNMLTLSYDRAAWKVPCTLEKVLNFLRYAFNCYWDVYVDENGGRHFRVEHVFFYDNGLSYDSEHAADEIGATSLYNPSNGKKYSFKSNNWKYDTTTYANTIELSWMDKQSEYFDGTSIETPKADNLYTEDKKEEKNIDYFSTDIDYLSLNTDDISKDGFMAVQTLPGDPYKVPSSELVNGYQNYLLSFSALVPKFLLYGLYQEHVTFNGSTLTVTKRKRMRKADFEMDAPKGSAIDVHSIVCTEVGKGVIESMEVDHATNHYKFSLRYETE